MPVPHDRPNNLFEPVPECASTHGMFDDRATARSFQSWANTHRGMVAGGCSWALRRGLGRLAAGAQ